jgi:hypothetical protein
VICKVDQDTMSFPAFEHARGIRLKRPLAVNRRQVAAKGYFYEGCDAKVTAPKARPYAMAQRLRQRFLS